MQSFIVLVKWNYEYWNIYYFVSNNSSTVDLYWVYRDVHMSEMLPVAFYDKKENE